MTDNVDIEQGGEEDVSEEVEQLYSIMYVVKRDFFWFTKDIWTISYESWIKLPNGKERHFPKIIQCKGAIKEQVEAFLKADKNHTYGFKDLTKK